MNTKQQQPRYNQFHKSTAVMRRRLVFGVAVVFCAAGLQTLKAQPRLTGSVLFSCNSSGNFDNDSWWNTLADGNHANLYVTVAGSGINGSFINSGNANPATRIDVPLSAGTHTFYILGEPGNERDFWGLNLFFDGDDANPRISVFAPKDVAPSPPYPSFLANGSGSTPRLGISPSVPAAGSLRFTNGDFVVSLTDFRWSVPDIENVDRVSYFNNVPSGIRRDFVGHFTVNVIPVSCRSSVQPLASDSNTVLLDLFDGSSTGTIAAYRQVAGCGSPAPAVTPNFSFGPGPDGLSQGLTLRAPASEPAGSATYIQYSGGQLLAQAAGTLEFWVYLTTHGDGLGLVTQAPFFGSCAGYTFHMVTDASGQLQANAHDFGFNMNSGANRVPLNAWTHLAVTWGSGGARLYINGQVVGTDANGRGPSPGYGGSVLVRVGSHTASANNRIDQLRISNIPRTSFNLLSTCLELQIYAGVTIHGEAGASYRIEYASAIASPNNWMTLTNLTLPSSPYVLIDYESPNAPRRFYRAVRN